LYEIYETIQGFLDRGGDVMVVLAWVVFVMWTLIIKRLMFLRTENRIQPKGRFDRAGVPPGPSLLACAGDLRRSRIAAFTAF